MLNEYNHLLQIIAAQKEALNRDDFNSLQKFTDKKKKVIDDILGKQEQLNSTQRAELADIVGQTYKKIVREDEILNLLLKEKKILLAQEKMEVDQSQSAIRKIESAYGRHKGDAGFNGEG